MLQRHTPVKVQRLSSRSSSTSSSTSLSRCRTPVCQNASSKPQRFHNWRIQKIMEIPQVRRFRRSWRFSSCSTQSRWPMTLLRVQKTAQMPLVQFTEKLVEVTVTMRTSSGSQGTTANSRDVTDSGSGNSSEWWTLHLCSRQGHWQEKIQKAVETTQVQFKEMIQQYRNGCRTSRKLLRSHRPAH